MDGYMDRGRPRQRPRSPFDRLPEFHSSQRYGGGRFESFGSSTLGHQHYRSRSLDNREYTGELFGRSAPQGSSAHRPLSGRAPESRAVYRSQYGQQGQYRVELSRGDIGGPGRLGSPLSRDFLGASGDGGRGTIIPIQRGVAPFHHRSAHTGLNMAGRDNEWTTMDKSERYHRERTDYPPAPRSPEHQERSAYQRREEKTRTAKSRYGDRGGGMVHPPLASPQQAIAYPDSSDYERHREEHQRSEPIYRRFAEESGFADHRDKGATDLGPRSYHHAHHRHRHYHESAGGGGGDYHYGMRNGGSYPAYGTYTAGPHQQRRHSSTTINEGGTATYGNGTPPFRHTSSYHSGNRQQQRTGSARASWFGRSGNGGRKQKQQQQLFHDDKFHDEKFMPSYLPNHHQPAQSAPYFQPQARPPYSSYPGEKPPTNYHKVRCCCFTFKWPPWAYEPCEPPRPMGYYPWGRTGGYSQHRVHQIPVLRVTQPPSDSLAPPPSMPQHQDAMPMRTPQSHY